MGGEEEGSDGNGGSSLLSSALLSLQKREADLSAELAVCVCVCLSAFTAPHVCMIMGRVAQSAQSALAASEAKITELSRIVADTTRALSSSKSGSPCAVTFV